METSGFRCLSVFPAKVLIDCVVTRFHLSYGIDVGVVGRIGLWEWWRWFRVYFAVVCFSSKEMPDAKRMHVNSSSKPLMDFNGKFTASSNRMSESIHGSLISKSLRFCSPNISNSPVQVRFFKLMDNFVRLIDSRIKSKISLLFDQNYEATMLHDTVFLTPFHCMLAFSFFNWEMLNWSRKVAHEKRE